MGQMSTTTDSRKRGNYVKDYWKTQPDAEADTGKNVLRYFAEAHRLQVSMPYWTDRDGNQKPGKTVALNLDALADTPEAVQLIERVIADISKQSRSKE